MTTNADVAALVANAIDGAEFLEHTVTTIKVERALIEIGLDDGTEWRLDVWRDRRNDRRSKVATS